MKFWYSHYMSNAHRQYNNVVDLCIRLYPDPNGIAALTLTFFDDALSVSLVETEHVESAGHLRQLAALALAIEKQAGTISFIGARKLAKTLQTIGAIETVYDQRERKRVPLKDVRPPDIRRYVDDYEKTGDHYCQWSVLAVDQDNARRIMTKAAASNVATLPTSEELLDRFARWTSAGRPVKLIDYEEAPDTTTLIDRITAMKGAQ